MNTVAMAVDGEPAMKIYDFPIGPYPTRVRIALAEKNLQSRVEFVMVDLRKGEHKDPEFIAGKNYSGTVPVLELADGTCIAECTAITEYLDALVGEPVLTGSTAFERGMIHMMSKRAELELLDAISVYSTMERRVWGHWWSNTRTGNGDSGSATRPCVACIISTMCFASELMLPATRSPWPTLRSSPD